MALEPHIGEISEFAFRFAPEGWADCAGQILQVSQNAPLFSLLGTTYGGDGIHTFALPDLRPFADNGPDYGKHARVDWNEKGLPRKCIALVGIYPARS